MTQPYGHTLPFKKLSHRLQPFEALYFNSIVLAIRNCLQELSIHITFKSSQLFHKICIKSTAQNSPPYLLKMLTSNALNSILNSTLPISSQPQHCSPQAGVGRWEIVWIVITTIILYQIVLTLLTWIFAILLLAGGLAWKDLHDRIHRSRRVRVVARSVQEELPLNHFGNTRSPSLA